MISVALHVHPGLPGSVYWEEADAWARMPHQVDGLDVAGVASLP
jgi:hypothetical protein